MAKSSRLRLCVDIDNVLCDTDAVMRRLLDESSGGRVKLRYEDIRFFEYRRCTDPDGRSPTDDDWRVAHDRFSSDADILRSLQPIPDAFGSLERLSDKYMIHFATSRKKEARAATADWLESHAGSYLHDLHFVTPGEKHVALGTFAASVEDQLSQAIAFAQSGAHSYVLAHPWNTIERVAPGFPLARRDSWLQIAAELLDGPVIRPDNLDIV